MCIFLEKRATFQHVLLYLYVFKQTLYLSRVLVSQIATGAIMQNLRHIIFM